MAFSCYFLTSLQFSLFTSPYRPVHKPLDNEHVSGNELDSSNDEEDESEDDPNKLWCICNQPHNNRFMICCDTCEEWYHGKCVNITKAMGQQMEAEGKEWICLYCKVSITSSGKKGIVCCVWLRLYFP